MALIHRVAFSSAAFTACVIGACANGAKNDFASGDVGGSGAGDSGGAPSSGVGNVGEGGLGFDGSTSSDAGKVECAPCSEDGTDVLNCDGTVKDVCQGGQLCGAPGQCMAACDAAKANKSSIGCDYYAVAMAALGQGFGGCFVSFIANTSSAAVHIQATFGQMPLDLAQYAKIPSGTGGSITYGAYDPAAGLAPNQVAILFLANDPVPHGTWKSAVACPVKAAIGLDAQVHLGASINTGRGTAFHVTTDAPVVAYQMLPFGGGAAATTGATLLLPTSAWDTNYVAVEASRSADAQGESIPPTMDIVAEEDGTNVTILPKAPIKDGIGVVGGPANQPISYAMKAGEVIEIIQDDELTGSPISSDKPIAVFAGHMGLRIPFDIDWSDHAEQQIAPVRALGSEYAAASYRDRIDGVVEHRRYRLVGAVDGTTLTFSPSVSGAPSTIGLGDVAEFESDAPFIVKSQDDAHPFSLFTYMSGSSALASTPGYGDPDFVRIVPGAQYLSRYVFFTDPSYPETNLVVIRKKTKDGFADVTLDCAGKLTGFTPVGDGQEYEMTRIDLSRHNFEGQGACNNGRHEMSSPGHFGLWVWGWGSPETRPGEADPCDDTKPDNSCDVSYGYPAGENVTPINDVYVPSTPK